MASHSSSPSAGLGESSLPLLIEVLLPPQVGGTLINHCFPQSYIHENCCGTHGSARRSSGLPPSRRRQVQEQEVDWPQAGRRKIRETAEWLGRGFLTFAA